MDGDVASLLSSWELEQLVPTFLDQDVNLHVLKTIDGELLKELIPSIGHRSLFLSKRKEYLRSIGPSLSIESESEQDLETVQVLALHHLETDTVVPSFASSQFTASAATAAVASPSTLKSSVTFKSTSKSSVASKSALKFAAVASTSGTVTAAGASTSTSNPGSFVQNIASQFCLNKFIVDIDLSSVFQGHVTADAADAFYQQNCFLTGSHRTAVVDALMNHLWAHAKKFGCTDSIKNDHLDLLASRIVSHFPTERHNCYYIPPAKGSVATAKLVTKLRNLRRRKSPGTPSRPQLQSSVFDDPVESVRCGPQDPNVDVDAAINFLAFTRSPWPEVEEKWALTLQHRLKQLQAEPYLNTYFESWPVLQSPNGCTLLEADFNSLWPGREMVIFSKWPVFEERILTLAKTDVKDKYSRALFNLLKPSTAADSRAAIALSLLPAICTPTKKLKLPNGKIWCPSIAEARSSMILHAQAANKVRSKIKEHTEQVFLQGQRVQPLVIVVGPSIDKITKSYVCVDKILWSTSCVMKSLDICFKAIFATESDYPAESRYLWEAIQKSIYKITTKHDQCVTPLDNLV